MKNKIIKAMALYKDQIINSDCACCNLSCLKREQGKDCCFASCTNHCFVYISEYDSKDKELNDGCTTCCCTLLCFAPKFIVTLPFWPFTFYNCLRNKCKDTSNVNYIC